MNFISFANFTQSDNQNSFLPTNEKDGGNGEDFSLLLNNISVTLQTAATPVTNFQNNFQVQTVSETGQNLAFGNNNNLAIIPFVQTSNPELKTNLNQTFFSTEINPQEISSSVVNSERTNQPVVIKTETPNPNLQTESVISPLQVKTPVQIPTNFQPLPNLPTMQNLWSENSVKVNLPPIPKPQTPLPDNQNLSDFSSQDLSISNNPISFKTTISENAKEFEIVKEPDHFVSNQNRPLVSELKPETKITEENIFPQISNLPNTSLSANDNQAKIEVEFTKVPEIQSTVEKPQVIETKFESHNTKIDYSLNLNQTLNVTDSTPKSETSNFAPKLNSVLEYPVSQKIDLPQVSPRIDLPQKENSTLLVSQKVDFSINQTDSSLNQEVEISIPQQVEPMKSGQIFNQKQPEAEISIPEKVELPQNPINLQTVEIKTEPISEKPTVQANLSNIKLSFENKTEVVSESLLPQTNIPETNIQAPQGNFENETEIAFEPLAAQTNTPNLPTNFESKIEATSENPPIQRDIPVSQSTSEIKTELKAEPVLREVSSFDQSQQDVSLKVEAPTETKLSEVEIPAVKLPPVVKTETKPIENTEIEINSEIEITETKIKAEVKPDLIKSVSEVNNEVIVEIQQPKVENYELNSEPKPAKEKPILETVNLPIPNNAQSAEVVSSELQSVKLPVNKIQSVELPVSDEIQSIKLPVSNKIQPEVENYEVKPLNVVSQNSKEKPVNQPIQSIPFEETKTTETTNNNPVKFSLPTEENVIPQAKAKTFTLNTENTEPASLDTKTVETAKTPEINPDNVLTTDFTEKAKLSESKTVSPKSKNNEDNFVLDVKPQLQNHELPTNQKPNQTQDTSANESFQTETTVKISETNSSNSSPYFDLSDTSEQKKKFNDPQNDLTVNFDKIFDNIIKKKEAVEAAPKAQTEPTKIAEQVTPQLLQMAGLVEKKNGKEILKLRLNPAELGTVEITLEKNSSGVLSAHFKTENESARQALSNGLEQLRDNLQNSGWNIGQMEISNSSSSLTDNQNRQHNQQKSEWIENFSFNRSSEKPDDSENNSPARLLNLLA